MILNKEQALNYIKETKDFWKVTDFQSEILDFNPCEPHVPADLNFYIGHPEGSVDYRGHRGLSVGDVLPYTVLPKLLKETYADCKVFIPEWFNDIFQNNLYVDGNHSYDYKWGSMGTFGTTVQRCANVWGLKSNKYAPKLYPSSHIKKRENTILFTINSKTGGRVTNVDLFEEIIEHLSKQYTCVQMGLSDDYMVKSASQNILNVSRDKLVDFVAEFPIYIGAQSSIYHIAKGLGLKVVGILPDIQKLGDDGDEAPIYAGIGAEAVMLPLLTTTAPLEVEPCDEKYWNRAKLLNPFFPNLPPYSEWPAVWPEWNDPILLNHNISHIGWLYPDTPHLTVGNEGTSRCPTLSVDTIDKALNGEIYPFNDDRLWDYYTHSDLWTNTDEYINDGDNIKNKKYVDSIDLYDLRENSSHTLRDKERKEPSSIEELSEAWNYFGSEDPMWYILTEDGKKFGKWDPEEFFETGVHEINKLSDLNLIRDGGRALDFGCGIGRCTEAIAPFFKETIGVDISETMIETANKYGRNSVKYIVNQKSNLELFDDNSFDYVYSNITLQHMSNEMAISYIKEFMRILKPDGMGVFQIPDKPELNLNNQVKGYRHPDSYWVEMHGLPVEDVKTIINGEEYKILDISEDSEAGSDWLSYRYTITGIDGEYVPTVSLNGDRWVLGVNIGHDCGATLVKNGKVYVSIQQERVSRIKHDEGGDTWPILAMDYCLDYAKIEKTDLERIVWNGIGFPYSVQVDVNGSWVNDLRNLGYNLPDDKLNYCTHHLAHAYSAHYSSGFEESVVVVVDAGGEINYKDIIMDFVDNKIEHIKRLPMNNSVEASSIYEVKKGVFNKIYSNYKPIPEEPSGMWWPRLGQSVGEFYAIGCNRMGMTWLDAGKLMGMAPYGREEIASTKFPTESVIYIDSDPKYGDYLIRCTPTKEWDNPMPLVTEWDSDIFDEFPGAFWDNPPGLETEQFQDKADWAWWIQNQFEQIILFLAKKASMNSDVKNLCGAGGCFLNSVGNQKIVDLDLFENHFYVPAADDGGISLGCAFYGYYNFDKDIGKVNLSNKEEEVFMGREYDDDEILEDIEKYSDDITFTKIKDEEELSKKVARLISTGKVVGWFQGGSEMGPRALGHRSILADATDPDMKDIINERIKHREWYRPFAPACIKEDAHKYFTHSTESPYMLLIAQVKEEYKDKLPSITHVDGTARLQTVNRETNRRYYDVIKEFGIISGISVILNTSFNEAGEPIVETPENAIKCFLKNNIDYLVIENYFIERKNLDTKKLGRLVPKNKENKV